MKTIAEFVNGVKDGVFAIPDIQDDIEPQEEEDLSGSGILQQEYCNGFWLLRCKVGPLFDDKISKHLLSVSTVFTADYVGLAASSTMPKVLHTQVLLVYPQENKQGARCILDFLCFLERPATRRLRK
jgi:hypothetical protein